MASNDPKTATTKSPARPAAKPVVAKATAKPVAKTVAAKPAAAPTVPAPTVPAPKVTSETAAPVAAKIEWPVSAAAPAAVIEKAAETVVKTVTKTVEATPMAAPVLATIKKEVNTMEANLKNAAEKAQTYFAEANDRAKAAMAKSTKMFEDMNEFNKGNVEALVESGKIAAKGFETLGQNAAEYGRKSFEGATATLKSLSTVKSPTDFFKLQSDYVRTSFDALVAETSKTTEAVLKLAGEVAQPISSRVAVAVEKVKIAA